MSRAEGSIADWIELSLGNLMTQSLVLGRIHITPTARAAISSSDVLSALQRHERGDWGQICHEDREANELALRDDARLLSVYEDRMRTTFWIITEADRSATTVLLPSDY